MEDKEDDYTKYATEDGNAKTLQTAVRIRLSESFWTRLLYGTFFKCKIYYNSILFHFKNCQCKFVLRKKKSDFIKKKLLEGSSICSSMFEGKLLRTVQFVTLGEEGVEKFQFLRYVIDGWFGRLFHHINNYYKQIHQMCQIFNPITANLYRASFHRDGSTISVR